MFSVPALIVWSMTPLWTQLNVGVIDPPAAGAKAQGMWVDTQSGAHDLDGEDGAHAIHFIAGGQPQPAGGPWLGISFGPVAKPLASQLRLDAGTGQVVVNVVEGSPADTAGLQQYDIITTVDGQSVSSKIDDFMTIIRGYKPGDAHSISLLRGGQRVTTTITIGARPEEIGASKYKNEDEEILGDRTFSRGGMLQKDDKGNWVFKGLNQPGLPDFWKMIPDPKDGDFNFRVPFGSAGSHMQLFMQKGDGQSTRIEKGDDGKITVITTTNENGKESSTTKTYNSEDELKAAEPEVAKMMCHEVQGFPLFGDADIHIQGLDDDIKLKIHEAMKDAHGAMGKASMFLKKQDGAPGAPGTASAFAFGHKARTSFETTQDGKVRVTTRNGGEELVTVYDNADALRAAQPELHKKYLRLQDSQGSTPKN
ncbi:MAG: PDZ domain-containing protein [Planctomycetota bacterium]